MNCQNCGKEIDSSYLFCAYCGAKIVFTAPTTPMPSLDRYYTLEAELDDIKDEIAELPTKHALLGRLRELQAIKEKELEQVRKSMESEKKDYDELLKLSFMSIKARFEGNIEERKKKEETEYLVALTNFQDVKKEVAQFSKEISQLNTEIRSITDKKRHISSLETEMHQIIEELTQGKSNKKLIALESQYNQLRSQLAEIQSIEKDLLVVKNLLSEAANSFLNTKKNLDSAKTYATWDTFFGRSLLVDSLKHNRIDNARQELNHAQTCIQRAQNLVDGLNEIYVHFEAPSFLIDYLFDSFLFDILENAKISRTLDRVNGVIVEIIKNQAKLDQYISSNEHEKMRTIGQVNSIRTTINKERLSLLG